MNESTLTTNIPFAKWDLDLLIDYAIKFHHRNTRKYGKELLQRLTALSAQHKELNQVVDLFRNSLADLDMHCTKEEEILYPYMEQLHEASQQGHDIAPFHCGSIIYPINAMMADHTDEMGRHDHILQVTNNYTAPKGSEPAYQKALDDLRDFRDYMLKHIAIENEVIFPRALTIESELMKG